MESTEFPAGTPSEGSERFAQLWGEGAPEVEAAPAPGPMAGPSRLVIRAERV